MTPRKLLTYNFLVAVQVALNFIFQVMLARHFGVSYFTDVYFIAIGVFRFISLAGTSIIEMFMQHYNDIKVRDGSDAKRFYQTVLNFSLLAGIASLIIVSALIDPILKISAAGFGPEESNALKQFFFILLLSLPFAIPSILNATLINTEMRFSFTYILGLIPPVLNIASLLFFVDKFGINAIAASIVISGVLTLLSQQYYIRVKFGIGPGRGLWHEKVKVLFKDSLSMRFGHQLFELKDIMAMNLLSRLPAGSVSVYFYAVKIHSLITVVLNSPVIAVFFSKASRLVSEGNLLEVKKLLRGTVLRTAYIFLAAFFGTAVLLAVFPSLLTLIFGDRTPPENIAIIYRVFLALSPFYLFLVLEDPLKRIIVAFRKSLVVIGVSIAFIGVFYTSSFFIGSLGIYTVPFTLCMAQLLALSAYVLNVKIVLNAAPSAGTKVAAKAALVGE